MNMSVVKNGEKMEELLSILS